MLALIAGQGKLPEYVARKISAPMTIASLEGYPPETLTSDRVFRIERLGSFLAELREDGVSEVCFAGAIRRPALDPSFLDAATMPLVPAMMQAMQQGDDAALRAVLSFFESAGLIVRGAHEIAPDLIPEIGVPTRRKPDADQERDALRGWDILDALGAADTGQSCVVHRGQALALEAMPGTDWMLKSIAVRPDMATGGVLCKGPKPNQDRRIDMPTIGPSTVSQAAKAGLAGIAIAAGGVLAIDMAEIVRRADDKSMFVWVRE